MCKRILLCFFTVIIGGFLFACGQVADNYEESIGTTSEFSDGSNIELMNIAEIDRIEIREPSDGVYKSQLLLQVKGDYLTRFAEVMHNIKIDNELPMRTPLYSLYFYNGNNEIVDTWTIDVYRTIITKDSNKFLRENSSDIDTLLSDIESDYGLGYDLLERVPGESYYSNIENADAIYIRSQDDSYFDDDVVIDYKVSNGLVDQMKCHWQEIITSSTQNKNYTIRYTINVSDRNGIALYAIHLADDDSLYTSTGYKLSGQFINEWIDAAKREANIQ